VLQRTWARLGAAGFEATEVTLGNAGDQGQVKLAQASLSA